MNLIGDVKGKNVILLDDMIDIVGIIVNVVNVFKEFGVKDVYVCCIYGVLLGLVIERIVNLEISELIVFDII